MASINRFGQYHHIILIDRFVEDPIIMLIKLYSVTHKKRQIKIAYQTTVDLIDYIMNYFINYKLAVNLSFLSAHLLED